MRKNILFILLLISSAAFCQNYSLGTGACSNVQKLALGDGTEFYCTKDKISLGKTNDIEFEVFISKYIGKDEMHFSIDLYKWVGDNLADLDVDQNFEVTFTNGEKLNLRSHDKNKTSVDVYFCKEDNNLSQFNKFKNKSIKSVKVTTSDGTITRELDATAQQAVRDNMDCMLGLAPMGDGS